MKILTELRTVHSNSRMQVNHVSSEFGAIGIQPVRLRRADSTILSEAKVFLQKPITKRRYRLKEHIKNVHFYDK